MREKAEFREQGQDLTERSPGRDVTEQKADSARERTTDHVNVDLLMKTLSEILSEMYGVEITMTARKKDGAA